MTRRLRIITHNVRVGRRPKVVARKVRRMGRWHRADVIMLQEAHGYIDALRDLRGWRLITAFGPGEVRGNPMLVRNNRDPVRRSPIRCQTPWTGPKAGRPHRGRVFTVAEVGGWLLVNVHRTRPGWSRNGAAFAEEHDRLLELADTTTGPLVIAGDQNIGTRPGPDRSRNTPWALARSIGANVVTTTAGRIDYAIARGADGRARQLGRYGSDHNAVLIVLTAIR
jgi:endonuclease/exonuclease/phosphatase (EEP) superfamily protein YafD